MLFSEQPAEKVDGYAPPSNLNFTGNYFFKQFMRVSLLTGLIIALTVQLMLASNAKAQNMNEVYVNFGLKNESLYNALKRLEGSSPFRFIYRKHEVAETKAINIPAQKRTVDELLSIILDKSQFSYSQIDKSILIIKNNVSSLVLKDQSGQTTVLTSKTKAVSVSGTVTGDDDQPLPSVTVREKNTNNATATDINGRFTLRVADANAVLVFSLLGYATKEQALNGQTTVKVVLTATATSMNEVVVIGYGAQKRENVTGAVASLKANNLDERPINRVDQALVGQLAGVQVRQTTGAPGKAFSVQVRGSGSLSAGNEPLYVIDGFPLAVSAQGSGGAFGTGNPLDNINPNDIESIEVLKDAASAAIYGSRGSNGVVLITTKRGKVGAPKLTYNTYAGYNAAAKYLPMLDGPQWIDRATEMINAAYVRQFASKGATANDNYATRLANVGAFNAAYFLDPRWSQPGYPGLQFIDWQKAISQKGLMMNQEVSASGGTESVKYYVSGNYGDQNGFIRGMGYKLYSARANVEVNATKKLKLGLNIAPTYSITKDPGVEGKDNIFHQAISYTPVQEDTVGLNTNAFKNAQYVWSNSANSPYAKLENKVGLTKRYRTLASVFGEYEIIKGLTLRTSLNFDNTDNTSTSYTPYTIAGTLANRTFNANTNTNPYINSSGSVSNYRRQTFVNENTLNYNKTFGGVHSLNVLLGQSYNVDRLDQSSASSVGGYLVGTVQTIASGTTTVNSSGGSSASKNVLISYFSRVQYAYKDRYLFSASLREDGSSRFGVNTKWGIFPSASVGWRIIEEGFMRKQQTVSDLKLRASFGVNGNNSIPDYGSIATLGSYGYVFNGVVAGGQGPNNLANPDIRWEKSETWDIGLDIGFLANRITASFDYYNKLNTDLLLNVPVLLTSGFESQLQNAGSVRNVGQELEITSRNLTGGFKWTTSVNVSHNTNKIVSLYGNQQQIVIPNSFVVSDAILKVGYPINSIYVVKQLGFLTQADIDNKVATYGTGQTVGDPKYQDLNGDGVITEADKQIVGQPNPKYTWGITNSFRFKAFDLSVLVQGQNGGNIYSLLGRAITRTGQGFTDNAPAFYANRWRSPSDQGAGRVSKAYSTFGFVANTDWLYSSDYVRVRNITLGYNLKSVLKTKAVSGARVYISAENFFGHDKYYGGFNPEAQNTAISSSSAYPEPGDYGGMPLAKSLVFGLNVTF